MKKDAIQSIWVNGRRFTLPTDWSVDDALEVTHYELPAEKLDKVIVPITAIEARNFAVPRLYSRGLYMRLRAKWHPEEHNKLVWGENLEDYPGPHVQVTATRSLVAAKQTKGNQLQIQQQKKKIAKVAAKQTKPLKQKQALKPNGAKNKKKKQSDEKKRTERSFCVL